jgi:hypothetical protein
MTINHPAHRDLCSARYEHFRIELNKRKTYALQKGGCSGKFTLVQALVNKREEVDIEVRVVVRFVHV